MDILTMLKKQAEQVEVFNLENEKTTVEYEANQLKDLRRHQYQRHRRACHPQGAARLFCLYRPDGRGQAGGQRPRVGCLW